MSLNFSNYRFFLILGLSGFILSLISIFYFSWIPNPRLTEENLLPLWLAQWADEYDNLRTAVPFVLLGFSGGLVIGQIKLSLWFWLKSAVVFFFFATLAEAGQLLLPNRHFDWADIFWGVVGGLVGVAASAVLYRFRKNN